MKGQLSTGGKATPNQSVLNFINCILGAGLLGYPYCFKECGIVLATCLMLVSWLACRFSFRLLLFSSQLTNHKTYERVAESSLGKAGRHIVSLSIAALNLGALVAYINILADVLSAVAGTLIPPGADPSRSIYIAGVTVFGALPVALVVRDHSIVIASSTASVGFTALFAFVILIFSFFPASAATTDAVQLWNPDGLLVGLPVMAYSFTAHPYYLSIYASMQNPNMSTMNHVTDTSMSIVAVLYWLVGLGGYMTFRQRTAGDLLRNFGGSGVVGMRGVYEHALKLCYGLSVLGAVPLVIMPFQNILLPYLASDTEQPLKGASQRMSGKGSDLDLPRFDHGDVGITRPLHRKHSGGGAEDVWAAETRRAGSSESCGLLPDAFEMDHDEPHMAVAHHVLICFLVIGVAMASALWVPNVEFIFGLVGATASMLVAYILPPITFLRTLALEQQQGSRSIVNSEEQASAWTSRKWMAVVLLLFGIVSGVLCTDAILGAVQEEAAVVQLAQQIVEREAVVAEASRVEQQASAAATAVLVATESAHDLDQAKAGAVATRDNLQKAAAALSAITEPHNATHPPAAAAWDIMSKMKEHNKFVAEVKVMGMVEEQLQAARMEINRTLTGVESLVAKLDAAQAQIRAGASSQNISGVEAAAAGTAAGGAGGSQADMRAQDLAKELAKALGTYMAPEAAQNSTGGGSRSLDQVRDAAQHAAEALRGTLYVLDQVAASVAVARHQHKLDGQIKDAAMSAMQQAMEATAWSELAMNITTQALQHATTSETAELITSLSHLAHDLKKTTPKKEQLAAAKTAAEAGAAAAAAVATAAAAANAAATTPATPTATPDKGKAASSSNSIPPESGPVVAAGEAVSPAGSGEAHQEQSLSSPVPGVVASPGAAAAAGAAVGQSPSSPLAGLTPDQAAQAILADLAKLIPDMEAGKVNASTVVESISSALQYMQGSKAAIMQQLSTALSESHPKVAQRVMAIMGEMGNAERMQAGSIGILTATDRPLPAGQVPPTLPRPVTLAAAPGAGSGISPQPPPGAADGPGSAGGAGDGPVSGPVVKLTGEGKLKQEDGDGSDGTAGPIVRAQKMEEPEAVRGQKAGPIVKSQKAEEPAVSAPPGAASPTATGLNRRFGKDSS